MRSRLSENNKVQINANKATSTFHRPAAGDLAQVLKCVYTSLMTRPWIDIETVPNPDGELRLLQRGDDHFMITLDGRIIMVSDAHRSEEALAHSALQALVSTNAPQILIAGLGMGFTLRAALDDLSEEARVTVAELSTDIVRWCRGPLGKLTDFALDDPRVLVEASDVKNIINRAAKAGPKGLFDAILLDLWEGPNQANFNDNAPYYGRTALLTTYAALRPSGILAVWSEDPDGAFEKRLVSTGFSFKRRRPDGGGRRHVVYIAKTQKN